MRFASHCWLLHITPLTHKTFYDSKKIDCQFFYLLKVVQKLNKQLIGRRNHVKSKYQLPISVFKHCPDAVSQIRQSPSLLLETMSVPSRLKSTAETGSEWAGRDFKHFPVLTSQIRTDSSNYKRIEYHLKGSQEPGNKPQMSSKTF